MGELGVVGIQCPYLARKSFNIYHTLPGLLYEEITASNQSIKELVLTDLHMAAFPIIRYKTGDAVEFIQCHYVCKCGRKGLIIHVLGRASRDSAQLTNQFMIHVLNIKSALLNSKIKHKNFHLEIRERLTEAGPKPLLKLILFLDKMVSSAHQKRILKKLKNTINLTVRYEWQKISPLLSSLIQKGQILEFSLAVKKSDGLILHDEIVDKRIDYCIPLLKNRI